MLGFVHVAIVACLLGGELSIAGASRSRGRLRTTREERTDALIVDRQHQRSNNNKTATGLEGEADKCGERTLLQGPPGTPGIPGYPGMPGQPGERGSPGQCSCDEQVRVPRQIRQCAWNNFNYQISAGQVQTCSFNKMDSTTSLKVEWHGATRLRCLKNNSSCCARWYFTFDGAECVSPQPIDGLVYIEHAITLHRSMSVVGVCHGLTRGIHDIAFWVGDCRGSYPRGEAKTGWNSASRILIEELVTI